MKTYSQLYIFFSIIVLATITFSSCNNKYERIARVEGVYYPYGSPEFNAGYVGDPGTHRRVRISEPTRVVEIGTFTCGLGASWGRKDVVALLSGPGCYIDTAQLIEYGKLEYKVREATFSEWMGDNSLIIIVCAIFLSAILMSAYFSYRDALKAHREKEERTIKQLLEKLAIREKKESERRKLEELKESLRIRIKT